VKAFWSGHIAINLNFLPFIGRVGRHDGLVAALGYNGHGVAMAGHLGAIAGGMALGIDEAPAALKGIRYVPLPPEPLRYGAARAFTAALELVDGATDRKATPRR
jgi:gamma-glutamylputrescine oxidase